MTEVTLCQVYAPTTDASDDTTDAFYNDLQQEMHRIPNKDSIILMGDFNAKVGTGDQSTNGLIGLHGIGERNERGDRLLDFCYANNLCISNTCFKQTKLSRSWTWESPDKQTYNKIDYILVSKKLMYSVGLQNSIGQGCKKVLFLAIKSLAQEQQTAIAQELG